MNITERRKFAFSLEKYLQCTITYFKNLIISFFSSSNTLETEKLEIQKIQFKLFFEMEKITIKIKPNFKYY